MQLLHVLTVKWILSQTLSLFASQYTVPRKGIASNYFIPTMIIFFSEPVPTKGIKGFRLHTKLNNVYKIQESALLPPGMLNLSQEQYYRKQQLFNN